MESKRYMRNRGETTLYPFDADKVGHDPDVIECTADGTPVAAPIVPMPPSQDPPGQSPENPVTTPTQPAVPPPANPDKRAELEQKSMKDLLQTAREREIKLTPAITKAELIDLLLAEAPAPAT